MGAFVSISFRPVRRLNHVRAGNACTRQYAKLQRLYPSSCCKTQHLCVCVCVCVNFHSVLGELFSFTIVYYCIMHNSAYKQGLYMTLHNCFKGLSLFNAILFITLTFIHSDQVW